MILLCVVCFVWSGLFCINFFCLFTRCTQPHTTAHNPTHTPKMAESNLASLWSTTQQWQPPSIADLSSGGGLALPAAYALQMDILGKWLATGEKQLGWKIGASAEGARKTFGLASPISGYLLASREHPSATTLNTLGTTKAAIESELCFTLGAPLGARPTREEVLAAVAAVAPSFEIIDLRVNLREHMSVGIADDCMQWGIVTGTPQPVDAVRAALQDLGAVRVVLTRNGVEVESVVGKDVIDNQLDSIAWLATHLADMGQGLKAGEKIMTGTFTKPTPIAPGDTWHASFEGFGDVSAVVC